jgi:hypothetical protein
MGVPLGLVGIWLLLRYGMEAIGGHLAWRFKDMFIKLGIIKPFSMQLYPAVVSGILLGLSSFYPLIILLPIYGGYYFVMSCTNVLLTDTLQEAIENQGRATVQSLASMLEGPGGMLIYAIFGAVGGFKYLQGAMIAVTIWIFGLSFLFWVIQDKINSIKHKKNLHLY